MTEKRKNSPTEFSDLQKQLRWTMKPIADMQRELQKVYEDIRTEFDRQRFAQDPVPNRHAAVHGLVSYSSMQNSLNTIFLADYIFQVISFVKNPSR